MTEGTRGAETAARSPPNSGAELPMRTMRPAKRWRASGDAAARSAAELAKEREREMEESGEENAA